MTNLRDFDRLNRAWLDLMPDEAPDRVIDAVLQAVEVTPQQRRGLRWPLWRLPQMNRLSLTAAVVVLVAMLASGSVILSQFRAVEPGASGTTPTATPVPSATPLVPGLGRGMGYPAFVMGEIANAERWVADTTPNPALGQIDPRIELVTAPDLEGISIVVNGSTNKLASQTVTAPPQMIALVGLGGVSGCKVGEYGVYQLLVSPDALQLTLRAVEDSCPLRAATLARTWTKSFDFDNHGGRGVVAPFDPMLEVTLPEVQLGATGEGSRTLYAGSIDRTFIAVQNPLGATDPCGAVPGAPKVIGTNTKAFLAYLRSLPGFDVRTTAFSIDGRPGVRVTIPVTATASCHPADGRVFEWTDHIPGDLGWFIRQGDTDVLYLVDVGSDLYLLQYLGDGVTPGEEQAVMSTIHLIDSLPTGT